MRTACGRPIVAVCSLLLPFTSNARQQDRHWADLEDALLAAEIAQLGGYQELLQEFVEPTLSNVPPAEHAGLALTFRDAGLRVRVESYPFDRPELAGRSHGAWAIDGVPALGWTPGEAHTRLARLELVLDGQVISPPLETVTDVFDLPLADPHVPCVAVFRSRDGWRTYVHAQAGTDAGARMITWVFEDGRFLFRVVDPLPW